MQADDSVQVQPPARSMTTLEVARALGREAEGAWKAYDKRQVLNWCKSGVKGSGPCPHDKVSDRSKAGHTLRLNLNEVIAWAKAAGLEVVPRPAGLAVELGAEQEPGEADGVPKLAPLELAAEQARLERMQAIRQQAAELLTGDPLDVVRMLLLDAKGMLDESRDLLRRKGEAPTGEWLKNLTTSIGKIGVELRQHEKVQQERAAFSRRLIARDLAVRTVCEALAVARQTLTGVGPTLVQRLVAGVEAAGLAPALQALSGEVFERIAAAALQAAVDELLLRISAGMEQAAGQLEHVAAAEIGAGTAEGGGDGGPVVGRLFA